jgi:hypothetical protein
VARPDANHWHTFAENSRYTLGENYWHIIGRKMTLGQRLVCRPFNINSQDLILAVTVPNHQTSYRRLTNQAIAAISRTWYQQAE